MQVLSLIHSLFGPCLSLLPDPFFPVSCTFSANFAVVHPFPFSFPSLIMLLSAPSWAILLFELEFDSGFFSLMIFLALSEILEIALNIGTSSSEPRRALSSCSGLFALCVIIRCTFKQLSSSLVVPQIGHSSASLNS